MENDKTLERINNTYQTNLEHIEKVLLNVGINIRKDKYELKSLSEILKKISDKWDELSTEENKFINKWICMSIARIKDVNYLSVLIDKIKQRR